MRRFSSEGNLLDLDFLPWKRFALQNPHNDHKLWRGGTYTPHNVEETQPGDRSPSCLTPTILEPSPENETTGNKKQLTKEHSISVEDFTELGKVDKGHLGVSLISEGCRAYSDGQLAASGQGSSDSMERAGRPPSPAPLSSSSSSSSLPLSAKQQHRHHLKLTAAKLHLKSLFGTSPTSSNSNLSNIEEKDSATERRSRLQFMRQWSQMGPGKKNRISGRELQTWGQSLNALLASQTGVSVFGAFLRSEFSEENLQFYLACEQYRQSSNNFSLQRRAKDIYSTYIQPGAPREVNLDSKTRDLTRQLLQAPSHTSLSHAQKRIYSLLDTDCYPRFLQSNIYLSLLREAD